MFCTWSVRVCVQDYAIVRHGVSEEIGPDKINSQIFTRYFSGLAFWAECFVPNVILSTAPVEKPPALHLILHCRSGMSTNGPNCKKTHLKEYISNSKVF